MGAIGLAGSTSGGLSGRGAGQQSSGGATSKALQGRTVVAAGGTDGTVVGVPPAGGCTILLASFPFTFPVSALGS